MKKVVLILTVVLALFMLTSCRITKGEPSDTQEKTQETEITPSGTEQPEQASNEGETQKENDQKDQIEPEDDTSSTESDAQSTEVDNGFEPLEIEDEYVVDLDEDDDGLEGVIG